MKVYFERTGGFMGLRVVADFDTRELPEEEAKTLMDLLDEVDFFQLPSRLEADTPGMDQFHYVLTCSTEQIIEFREDSSLPPRPATLPEDTASSHPREADSPEVEFEEDMDDDGEALEQGKAHTVEFTDAAAPLEMLPLVRMLTRMARGQ